MFTNLQKVSDYHNRLNIEFKSCLVVMCRNKKNASHLGPVCFIHILPLHSDKPHSGTNTIRSWQKESF